MKYLAELVDVMGCMEVTDHDNPDHTLEETLGWFSLMLEDRNGERPGSKVMLVGNGGSAAIASHTAIDLVKNCGVRAMAFNDVSALTCLANDIGYEHVFAEQVRAHGFKGDTLVAISSSGKSANILKAVEQAHKRGIFVVTFSGFRPDNPLRASGQVNFYVPSMSYGHVELAHGIMLHAVTDAILGRKSVVARSLAGSVV
jgi:D-sedoheptulose 7-phosphate isomerase